MRFSLCEHRLCRYSEESQPHYQENSFGNLPNKTLFTHIGDDVIWTKEDNTAFRYLPPTEQEKKEHLANEQRRIERERYNQNLRGLLPTEATIHPRPLSSIRTPISNDTLVEVAYVPLQAEIREQFDQLLRASFPDKSLPSPLEMMIEREELLRAEKARRNDQSPIMDAPWNNLERPMDWADIPTGSFFITADKKYGDAMVYMKMSDRDCESMCPYETWNDSIVGAKFERKVMKFTDIQRYTGDHATQVMVLSALQPDEEQRIMDAVHDRLKNQKVAISDAHYAFAAKKIEALNRFWQNAA